MIRCIVILLLVLTCLDVDACILNGTNLAFDFVVSSGCSDVHTDLRVTGDDNLTALYFMESLTGQLTIEYSELTSLNGLQTLTYISDRLLVSNNAELESFSGLGNLLSVGSLFVNGNGLRNFSGLESLKVIEENLSVDTSIHSFLGLGSLIEVGGSISIVNVNYMQSMAGLENLTTIGGSLNIQNAPALSTFDGLNSLTYIGGRIYVEGTSLTSLTRLESISEIDSLIIRKNPDLVDFDGLQGLRVIRNGLNISNNPVLSTINFGNLDIVGSIDIHDNNLISSVTFNSTTKTAQIIDNTALLSVSFVGDIQNDFMLYGNEELYSLDLSLDHARNVILEDTLCLVFNVNLPNITNRLKIRNNVVLQSIVSNVPIKTDTIEMRVNKLLAAIPKIIFNHKRINGNNLKCNLINGNDFECCGDGIWSPLNNEVCDDPVSCNDVCVDCSTRYYGTACDKECECENGFCDYGVRGTGECVSCDPGYFGKYCNQTCTCEKGNCNDGLNGDGFCLTCFTKYYGVNCENYCFCGDGDCDERTGVCFSCNEGSFGTNCRVPIKLNRLVFPVVNCLKIIEYNRYTAYLGYANTGDEEIDSTTISNVLTCGDVIMDLSIDFIKPGQNNFLFEVECVGNLRWILGGNVVEVLDTELKKYRCEDTPQKLIIPIQEPLSEVEQIDLFDIVALSTGLNSLRIQLLTLVETKRSESYELLISFPANMSTSAQAVYQYTTDKIMQQDFELISNDVIVNALTFNESVGILSIDNLQTDSTSDSTDENQSLISTENNDNIFIIVTLIMAAVAIVITTILLVMTIIKSNKH